VNVYLASSRADGVASPREVAVVADDGSVLCGRCGVAETLRARMRGLLGRRALLTGNGLLLRPAPSIHTFFMRFPIDVVFLDRQLRVVRIDADVKPWRMRGCRGARAVIELAAGEAERRGFRPGQQLHLIDSADVSARRARVARADVLLVGVDRRFLSVTGFLLSRVGFAVRTCRSLENLVFELDRVPVDVIVVDATGRLGETARMVASVRATHAHIGVVVVADADEAGYLTALSALPKWSPFDRLEEAIARAVDQTYRGRHGYDVG
jgi:uncharacterized membrane protein (UPF0127 family)